MIKVILSLIAIFLLAVICFAEGYFFAQFRFQKLMLKFWQGMKAEVNDDRITYEYVEGGIALSEYLRKNFL